MLVLTARAVAATEIATSSRAPGASSGRLPRSSAVTGSSPAAVAGSGATTGDGPTPALSTHHCTCNGTSARHPTVRRGPSERTSVTPSTTPTSPSRYLRYPPGSRSPANSGPEVPSPAEPGWRESTVLTTAASPGCTSTATRSVASNNGWAIQNAAAGPSPTFSRTYRNASSPSVSVARRSTVSATVAQRIRVVSSCSSALTTSHGRDHTSPWSGRATPPCSTATHVGTISSQPAMSGRTKASNGCAARSSTTGCWSHSRPASTSDVRRAPWSGSITTRASPARSTTADAVTGAPSRQCDGSDAAAVHQ